MLKKVLILFMILTLSIFSEKLLNEEEKIVVKTIENLVEDGFLSKEDGQLALEKYIEWEIEGVEEPSMEEKVTQRKEVAEKEKGFFNLINVIKVMGILFLLMSFHRASRKWILYTWVFIKKVPKKYYQITLLLISIFISFYPQFIWETQKIYVSFFAALANLSILYWIYYDYDIIIESFYEKHFGKIDMAGFICTMISIYSGIYAVLLESQLFGAVSIGSLLCALGFFFAYGDQVLVVGLTDYGKKQRVLYISFSFLILYALQEIGIINIAVIEPFMWGLNIISGIVFGVVILLSTSKSASLENEYFKLNIGTLVAGAIIGAVLINVYGITGFPQILNFFFLLVSIEWIFLYFKEKGFLYLTLSLGASLFLLALLLEKYSAYFITNIFR